MVRAGAGARIGNGGGLSWLFLLALGLAGGAAPTAAQLLEGRIVEADTGEPAEGVAIELTDLRGVAIAIDVTGPDGLFSLFGREPGLFLVRTSALGYQSVQGGVFDLGVGGRMEIEIRVELEPVGLDEVEVEVAPQESSLARAHPLIVNGFVERANSGRGRFLTPREIERSQHLDLPRILETTGRVEIVNGPRGRQVAMRRPGGLCDPVFFIDNRRSPGTEAWIGLDRGDLLGVEVYRSANEAPIEYGRFEIDCGVILVWTQTAATAQGPGVQRWDD